MCRRRLFCALVSAGLLVGVGALDVSPAFAVGPPCTLTAPTTPHVTTGPVALGGISSGASGAQFVIKDETGATAATLAGLPWGTDGYVQNYTPSANQTGVYTAACQSTGPGGLGPLSAAAPFMMRNPTANATVASPPASTRGARMGFSQTLASNDELDAIRMQSVGWYRGGTEWWWMINEGNDVAHGHDADPARPETWHWEEFKRQADHAHELGLKFLSVAMGSPYYANSANTSGKYYPNTAHLADWKLYIKGMLDRGADAIEVWNEPNNPGFIDDVDPAEQAGLQRYTYDYVKSINPNIQVITGGTAAFSGGNDFCTYGPFDELDPAGFLLLEYAAPAASYNAGRTFSGAFDAVGYHPYAADNFMPGSGFGAAPGTPGDCYDGVVHALDQYDVMAAFGDVKPQWMTEFGVKGLALTQPVDPDIYRQYEDGYLDGFSLLRALGVPLGVVFDYSIHNGPAETTVADDSYGVYFNNWAEKSSAPRLRTEAAAAGDTTPPTLSGVSATATGLTTATVTWTTNEGASSTVKYGTTTAYGSGAGATYGTSHSVLLTGLTPGVTYHYLIQTYDGSGNLGTLTDRTFAMPAPYATPIEKHASAKSVTTAAFNVAGPATIVALVTTAGPNTPSAMTVTVSSTTSGLSFGASPAVRKNTQPGDAEIWVANTTGALTGATVTSTESTGTAYNQMLTVLVFTRGNGKGNTASASGISTAPSTGVAPAAAGSIVVGAASDFTGGTAPVPGAEQSLITSNLINSGSTHRAFWTQLRSTPTAVGTTATVNDTLSTSDKWNLVAVEVTTK